MSSFTSVVTINAVPLPVLNYRDQRVITTEYLAQLYGTNVDNIRKNFSNNTDRFEQDRHFFKIEGDELRELSSRSSQIDKHTRNLTLWTERGAARHAKMLDTDQAWEVFEKLETAYFDGITPHHPQSANAILAAQLAELLKGKVLVDYETLRLVVGGALAARNVLDSLEVMAQGLEAECGQPLVDGLMKGQYRADSVAGAVVPRQPVQHGSYKKQSLAESLLDFISSQKADGARHGDLYRGCWAYRQATDQERETALNLLLDQGAIVQVQPESKPGSRRKALIYVAKQFVMEVAP